MLREPDEMGDMAKTQRIAICMSFAKYTGTLVFLYIILTLGKPDLLDATIEFVQSLSK